MNILIDDLPTDYCGYLINYTFKSGILISQCLIDESIGNESERLYTAVRILFGLGVPPPEVAIEGLTWFLNGGNTDKKESKSENESNEVFSFEDDSNRIYSAFMVKYGIDLNKSNMHFFTFLALFNDLDKTSFRRIVDLRSMGWREIKQYSKEDQLRIRELQKEFSIKKTVTVKEKETKTKFDMLIEGN